ncbi:MAG TPA: hypothetical protein VM938_09395 [Acidimicrobiales bacterium]|nr:hypothetical protein [Acidimicrobiales bacterium]
MTDAPPTGLSRRAFLTGTGAVLGSALLLGPNGLPRPGALARLAAANGPRLSLGYIEGSAGLDLGEARALLTASGTRVTPASSLRSGAKELVGGLAAVRVDSLTPGAAVEQAAQLDTLVSPPRGAGSSPLPFYAWTMKAGGAGSGPASFVTAVENEPSLGLAFRLGGRGNWQESTAVFTGGRDRGLPKLRPGTYLLGFDRQAWARSRVLPPAGDPSWAGLTSLVVTVAAA